MKPTKNQKEEYVLVSGTLVSDYLVSNCANGEIDFLLYVQIFLSEQTLFL
jgi:hypothetical protein